MLKHRNLWMKSGKWRFGWKWKFYRPSPHMQERTCTSGFIALQIPLKFWGAGLRPPGVMGRMASQVQWSRGEQGDCLPKGAAPEAADGLAEALKALLFHQGAQSLSWRNLSFFYKVWCVFTMTSQLTSLDRYLHFSIAKNGHYSVVHRIWKYKERPSDMAEFYSAHDQHPTSSDFIRLSWALSGPLQKRTACWTG